MSETKHTPGPWRTGREDMQSYDAGTGKPFGSVYCDDERAKVHLGERLPYVIARTFGDECKPNARLIAAAPDLLHELEEAFILIQGLHLGTEGEIAPTIKELMAEWCKRAEAAIRFAKGQDR